MLCLSYPFMGIFSSFLTSSFFNISKNEMNEIKVHLQVSSKPCYLYPFRQTLFFSFIQTSFILTSSIGNWDQYGNLNIHLFLQQNYIPSMLCVYGADLSAYICMCAVCRANVWRGGGGASIAVASAHTAYASNRAKADYYM